MEREVSTALSTASTTRKALVLDANASTILYLEPAPHSSFAFPLHEHPQFARRFAPPDFHIEAFTYLLQMHSPRPSMLLITDLPPEVLHKILVVFCVSYMGVEHEHCRWAVQRALRLKLVCRESLTSGSDICITQPSKYVRTYLSRRDMT